MLTWIFENISTILICIILLGLVTAIIVKSIRDRKRGKTSCGCGCANCAMNSSCHHNKK